MEEALDSVPVPEHLKCPICFEVPLDKVLQCKDGHVICESCFGKMKECPQCRVEFGPFQIRNRHIEGMLDELRFPCPFTSKGCGERLGRGELQGHSGSCPFDPSRRRSSLEGSVRICELLGHPNCAFRMRRNFTSEVILHLQLDHGHSLLSSEWPDFPENFETIEEQVMWVMSAVSSNGDVTPSAPPPLTPQMLFSTSGPNLRCSDCSTGIMKIAYQCLQCVSYLLCKKCHGKDKHRHLFAVSEAGPGNKFRLLDTRNQAAVPNNVIAPQTWWTLVADDKTKSDLNWHITWIGEKCDKPPQCKMQTAYVCLECSTFYCLSICEKCGTEGYHAKDIRVVIRDRAHFAFFLHFMRGSERSGWSWKPPGGKKGGR